MAKTNTTTAASKAAAASKPTASASKAAADIKARTDEKNKHENAGFHVVTDGNSVRQHGKRKPAGAFIVLEDKADIQRLRAKGVIRLPNDDEVTKFKAGDTGPESSEPADVVVENPDAEVARINAEEQAKKDAEAAGNAPPAAT